jgi:hypothetical protein
LKARTEPTQRRRALGPRDAVAGRSIVERIDAKRIHSHSIVAGGLLETS